MSKEVDAITLEYMINPKIYDTYIVDNKIESKANLLKDRKFYRKRIIQLTRDMFKSELVFPESIKQPFYEYIDKCIDYLKFQDKYDILQTEFQDISGLDEIVVDENISIEYATKQIMNVPKTISDIARSIYYDSFCNETLKQL